MDGKYLNGEEEIFVIGEVKEKEFIGVTEDNSKESLVRFLRKNLLENDKTIKVWSIDMSTLLRGVCKEVAPDAPIVSDKFHVIKYTNRVIDLCRIAVEKRNNERFEIKRTLLMSTKKLHQMKQRNRGMGNKYEKRVLKFETVLKTHPDIRLLWDLKNKVHGFYRCKSPETARKSWNALIQFLTDYASVHPEFTDLKKTFLNWETEILNYFIYRITNAYIEGLNNRIETLKRKKCGFRNKQKFIKALLYLLFPISHVFSNLLYYHTF